MKYLEIEREDAARLKDFVYLAIHVNDPSEIPDRSILEVPQIMKLRTLGYERRLRHKSNRRGLREDCGNDLD